MNDLDKHELEQEVKHIFDSGANEIRIINMIENFIDKHYVDRTVSQLQEVKIIKLQEENASLIRQI